MKASLEMVEGCLVLVEMTYQLGCTGGALSSVVVRRCFTNECFIFSQYMRVLILSESETESLFRTGDITQEDGMVHLFAAEPVCSHRTLDLDCMKAVFRKANASEAVLATIDHEWKMIKMHRQVHLKGSCKEGATCNKDLCNLSSKRVKVTEYFNKANYLLNKLISSGMMEVEGEAADQVQQQNQQ